MPVILIFAYFILVFIKKPVIHNSVVYCSAVLMAIIMMVWNNYSIQDQGIITMYGQFVPMLFFLICSRKSDWYDLFLKMMIFFGAFYTIGTYICLAIPSLYYNTIGPLFESLYPQAGYILNSKAGFTAHYSTNGMYIANGIAATLVMWIHNKENNRRTKGFFLLLVLELGALLICGKRGTLLCIILALYITYFLYNENKPKGRLFKLIVISFVAIVVVYVFSLVIPELANAYTRMLAMMDKNDVSTGRFDLWAAGWRGFLENPIFGHGWRWFYYNDTSVYSNYDIHNCYIQFLCELGIIGSAPFFIFFFYSYFRTIMLVKAWRKGQLQECLDLLSFNPLVFCITYQTFFLIFIFEGTAFYNPEALVPYLASCAMTEYVFMLRRKVNIREKDTCLNDAAF